MKANPFFKKVPTFGERAELRQAGWRFPEGKMLPDGSGYRPASSGGGYSPEAILAPGCFELEAGCPASHATVAVPPPELAHLTPQKMMVLLVDGTTGAVVSLFGGYALIEYHDENGNTRVKRGKVLEVL
jgi:hypothetical protein